MQSQGTQRVKAIMLAAGMGNRLGSAHDGPKCLLELGGRSLLARHLENLAAVGVDGLTLCLGYRPDAIVHALEPLPGPPVLIHYNPLFRLGSVVSLWAVRHTLLGGDDVLIMDADVLYHPQILRRLTQSRADNCYLLDRDFEDGEEPVKLCLDGARIVEFRKRLPPALVYDRIGESVGFFRFGPTLAGDIARRCASYVADGRGDAPHEEVLRDVALAGEYPIGVEDVTGLPWIEIDFPEDIERARSEILPRLSDQAP